MCVCIVHKCLGDRDLDIDNLDAHGLIYKLNFFYAFLVVLWGFGWGREKELIEGHIIYFYRKEGILKEESNLFGLFCSKKLLFGKHAFSKFNHFFDAL